MGCFWSKKKESILDSVSSSASSSSFSFSIRVIKKVRCLLVEQPDLYQKHPFSEYILVPKAVVFVQSRDEIEGYKKQNTHWHRNDIMFYKELPLLQYIDKYCTLECFDGIMVPVYGIK